ncbi:phospho-acceptor domain-containing protein [Azospira oryzae]|uniref:histidine kinase n=1 Tax=Azospira oryzae TaxID=146939 RepID=A0ABY0ISY3_9RHOO|nr:ATP-binding protein [Azospira oryzae]RZT90202.1 phospho-acceptor domain-containing protein [Azospira oryzae]
MTLRLKLLLPLALVWTAFIAYLYGIWLPDSVRYQIAVFERQQEREMHNLTESLLPLVVARQLGDIHDTLDSLRQENPEWVEVVLQDHEGRQLYPLAGTPVPPAGPDEQLHTQQLNLANDSVGSLRIRISHRALLESVAQSQKTLFALLASVLLGAFLALGVVLDATVRRPVNRLMTAARELAEGRFDAHLPPGGKDEIGTLVNTFAAMRDQVQATQQSLRQLNEHLEQRVQEELAKNREKDHMLIQQSRLAAMGEMVHNIAHQWRQPLNALSLLVRNIKDDYDFQALTPEVMDRSVADAQRLLGRMSTTIDDFRDFFRPEKKMTQFDVSHAVEEAVFIMQGTLKSHGIELVEKLDPGVEAEGFPSQFAQAVLNILANAKEEILARKVAAGRIEIELQRQGETILLRVSDNAGGIAPEILPKIFDPYFTTKDKGSGIGLYMAKTIIEHNMNGSISAANLGDGACFTLTVPVRQPKKN